MLSVLPCTSRKEGSSGALTPGKVLCGVKVRMHPVASGSRSQSSCVVGYVHDSPIPNISVAEW